VTRRGLCVEESVGTDQGAPPGDFGIIWEFGVRLQRVLHYCNVLHLYHHCLSILNYHSLIFLQVGSRPAAVERSGVDARLGRKRLACNE
jgi:hypothetical protein